VEKENLGKGSGVTDASNTNRVEEIEERLSGVEDTLEDIDIRVKETTKRKTSLTQYIQEIQDTMKRSKLREKIPNSKSQQTSSTKS
jgi:archaellum component FlaC